MLSKSDLGNYSYAPPGSPLPHAVTAVSGGAISTTFAYDPNGNQTSGLGRSISYTSYNKPSNITQGARTISFLDDSDHQRFKQVTPEGATLYIAAFGVLAELSSPGATGQRWTDYLSVGNAKVGMRVIQTAAETITMRYFHTDHLGSISVISNENGVVQERLSYDAWGKRRYPDGTDDATGGIASQTTRGFTGEEELSVAGLVHLNGRIYDPLLARMTSADPTVTDPMNAQGWNRYSYVGNDPLAFTDPNGFSWWGNAFGWLDRAVSGAWNALTNFIANNPIVRAVLQTALNVVLAPLLGPIGVAISAAVVTGLSGGNLGQMLRAGAIAGATAFAFAGLNSVAPVQAFGASFNPVAYVENVAGSALVGCASSVASGGSCGSGAAASAVSAGLSPVTNSLFPNAKNNIGERIGGTIVQATVGGLASVAGGGKFANGAVTGAFQYLVALGSVGGRADPRMDANDAYNGTYHDQVVQSMADRLRGAGLSVETEVPLEMADGSAGARIDIMAQSGGHTFSIEVKTGENPDFTPGQIVVYPHLMMGGSVYSPNDRISTFGFGPGEILPPTPVFLWYQRAPGEQSTYQELDGKKMQDYYSRR
jgi:RHS repeat-associated protein